MSGRLLAEFAMQEFGSALLEPGGQAAAQGGCGDTLCTGVPAASPRPLLAGAVLQLS